MKGKNTTRLMLVLFLGVIFVISMAFLGYCLGEKTRRLGLFKSQASVENRDFLNGWLSTTPTSERFLDSEPVEEGWCGQMSLAEAQAIFEESQCRQYGNLSDDNLAHICNESTATWWLSLGVDKPGCAPACVVDIKTKEVEINWRCTGLSPE